MDNVEQAVPPPRLIARPLSTRAQDHHRYPADDELHVWRFQSHWIPVQPAVSQAWLGLVEREGVRRHATPAAKRRFLNTRAAMRWLLSGIAGMSPDDAGLQIVPPGSLAIADDGGGSVDNIAATDAVVRNALYFDVVQAYAWTVIGIARAPLRLSTPTTNATLAVTGEEVGAGGVFEGRRESIIALPMPDPARITVACARHPVTIRGFGWRAGELLPD